jgi:membrane-associated protease RseP (regulator of RpoE activity)
MADDSTPTSDAASNPSVESAATGDADTAPALAAPSAAAASAPPRERKGIFVPRWLAILLGLLLAVLLVGGGGFALGRATDDDHDGDRRGAELPFPDNGRPDPRGGGGVPFPRCGDGGTIPLPLPGGPNGGGPNGGQLPGTPRGVLLGVSVETVTSGDGGAQVTQVVPGSPADDAGLQTDDVITKVDDTPVTNTADLVSTIQDQGAGAEVTITYERNGETRTADVTLGGEPSGSGSGSSSATS